MMMKNKPFSFRRLLFCLVSTTILTFILTSVALSGSNARIVSGATTTATDTFFNTTCHTSNDCNRGEYICIDNKCQSCSSTSQCQRGTMSICQSATIVINETIDTMSLPLSLVDGYEMMWGSEIDYVYSQQQQQQQREIQVKQCVKRGLWPLRWQDVLIVAICFVGGSFAASAGIGGGGIYVPTMLLIGGYTAQVAVPMSTVMIFGCAIANFLMLSPQKDPNVANRPIINYSAALIFQPIILGGSSLGVLLNTMIPNWLLVVLLSSLVSFTTYKTFKKGLDLRKKENQAAQAALVANQQQSTTTGEEDTEMEDNEVSASPIEKEEFDQENLDQSQEAELKEQRAASSTISDLEKQQYPIIIFALLAVPWALVFIISLLNGSKKAPSLIGIKQCSPVYWVLMILQYPLLFGYSMAIGWFYNRTYHKKVASGYKFEEGDIRWTKRNSVMLPCLFLTAGIVAGLLGIGGGMVTGPLLLSLGVPAQVSVATSSFMIFFTSSSTAAQFAVIGAITWDYALWFIVFGIGSGMMGQYLIGMLLKKFNKASWVVFCVVFTIAVSSIFMVAVGVYRTIQDLRSGQNLGFKSLCT